MEVTTRHLFIIGGLGSTECLGHMIEAIGKVAFVKKKLLPVTRLDGRKRSYASLPTFLSMREKTCQR